MSEYEISIAQYLLNKMILKQPIHITKDPGFQKYGQAIQNLYIDFESQWNEAIKNHTFNDNSLHACALLGLMHQVLIENHIPVKEFTSYFTSDKHFEELVCQDFKKYEDILFKNKAFSVYGPNEISQMCFEEKKSPIFFALLPAYQIIYEEAKNSIINFNEKDFSNDDFKYWKP